MVKKIGSKFKNYSSGLTELKNKVFFVVIALIIFRIGSFIPIPGINLLVLSKLLEHQAGTTIVEMFNIFSGGALSRASIFSLGIMPYISASIIIQLLTFICPKLMEIKKEGEYGRRVINQYIRCCTLFLSIIQSIFLAIGLPSLPGLHFLIINPSFIFYFFAVVSLVTGTMFLMWLGEFITEQGLGNGISIIIFSGLVAGLPISISRTLEYVRLNHYNFLFILLVIFFILSLIYLIIFIESSQRKIHVNYAQRQQRKRIYMSQSSYLPLKINMSGVMPSIFASSVVLFFVTILTWFGRDSKWNVFKKVIEYLQPGTFLYILIYACAIIFFCFFYTNLVFNSRETAENLKKTGAFILGIRPGEKTSKYINTIMLRLTLIGSLYITFICLIPELMKITMHIPFHFGGTSLLIVVIVVMDFISHIQTLIMSMQYESLLKKSKLSMKDIHR
ncbi:preprotein translocase subunit SecY [Buchnera aphidicola]|uniref:preprotein translocase subunit SecY n=1 Tax=Buchnera aphidicola TaxID=9 RepID=UPI0031B80C2E